MLTFDVEEFCCGCGACMNVCPTSAITKTESDDGFMIPVIDLQKCISCGLCERVCPHLNSAKKEKKTVLFPQAWLYTSPDHEAKMNSASGGAFFELAKEVLNKDGYVCGCAWDCNLKAVHILTNNQRELKRMQGSKYVQSDTGNCFNHILELLKEGKQVLFSGTPCQATALHNCVIQSGNGTLRESLLNIAVLCHGVPSPKVWDSYKNWEERKKGSPLSDVNFRDKSQEGYKRSYCKFEFKSGEIYYFPTYLPTSKYIEASLVYNLAIRKSCSHCDCKGINDACDLILGDWYAECHGEGTLGTSCIVSFTEKGENVVEKYLRGARKFSYENIVRDNEFIEQSVKAGEKREEFFSQLHKIDFWDKVENLYPPKYKYKKLLVKMGLYDLVKRIVG